jgi:hypothetical protein
VSNVEEEIAAEEVREVEGGAGMEGVEVVEEEGVREGVAE